MLRVRQSDFQNGVYAGSRIENDDVIEIPDYFGEIVFPSGMICREIRIGKDVTALIRGDSRIKTIYSEGRMLVSGNLWAGSVKSAGDVIIDGDLSLWLGDISVLSGDVCVSGSLRAEGSVTAHAGQVIVSGSISSPDPVIADIVWQGASGSPFPKRSYAVAKKAEDMVSFLEKRVLSY